MNTKILKQRKRNEEDESDENHYNQVNDEPSVLEFRGGEPDCKLVFAEYLKSLQDLGEHRGETFMNMMRGEEIPNVDDMDENEAKEFGDSLYEQMITCAKHRDIIKSLGYCTGKKDMEKEMRKVSVYSSEFLPC